MILGAAVIDDVMGLFVLAFLSVSVSSSGETFDFAPQASTYFQHHFPLAAHYPLELQMSLISVSVAFFLFIGYPAAMRWLDPLILQGLAFGRSLSTALADRTVGRSGELLCWI